MRVEVNGILLLDKPIDMTSNGALQKVKRLFQAKKAGHTGSLDPLATGMLPICFGEATKFSQFLLDADKSYWVKAKLGVQTTTGDREGEIIATHPVNVDSFYLEKVLQNFKGEQDQVPPMYSALKHQGKPLYKLARCGIEVERKPRRIQIYSLHLECIDGDEFIFQVRCSKGTYIRTLVEDIGHALACGAHVVELRRMEVSPYQNQTIYTLSELETIAEKKDHESLLAKLLPVETSVMAFPAITLSTASAFYLKMGQAVRINEIEKNAMVRLFTEDGKFIGMGEGQDDGRIKPSRLLSQNAY